MSKKLVRLPLIMTLLSLSVVRNTSGQPITLAPAPAAQPAPVQPALAMPKPDMRDIAPPAPARPLPPRQPLPPGDPIIIGKPFQGQPTYPLGGRVPGYTNGAAGYTNRASGYTNRAFGYTNRASGYTNRLTGYTNRFPTLNGTPTRTN